MKPIYFPKKVLPWSKLTMINSLKNVQLVSSLFQFMGFKNIQMKQIFSKLKLLRLKVLSTWDNNKWDSYLKIKFTCTMFMGIQKERVYCQSETLWEKAKSKKIVSLLLFYKLVHQTQFPSVQDTLSYLKLIQLTRYSLKMKVRKSVHIKFPCLLWQNQSHK